jgi:protein tyrosine phosphatase (PTP) superfamily phosphohydrolase (DUF442 family)
MSKFHAGEICHARCNLTIWPMSSLSHARLSGLLGVLFCTLIFSACGSIPRGVPVSEGIQNFGRVNGALFRGAQPDEQGLVNLARLGVRTIINLRQPSDMWPGEEAAARALGMGFMTVPLRGLGAPTDAQVARVLALIDSLAPPVFLHCEHGADRTGTIIACYRMGREGWTAERAFAEAKRHGFSAFQIGMRRYIFEYSPAPGR